MEYSWDRSKFASDSLLEEQVGSGHFGVKPQEKIKDFNGNGMYIRGGLTEKEKKVKGTQHVKLGT